MAGCNELVSFYYISQQLLQWPTSFSKGATGIKFLNRKQVKSQNHINKDDICAGFDRFIYFKKEKRGAFFNLFLQI